MTYLMNPRSSDTTKGAGQGMTLLEALGPLMPTVTPSRVGVLTRKFSVPEIPESEGEMNCRNIRLLKLCEGEGDRCGEQPERHPPEINGHYIPLTFLMLAFTWPFQLGERSAFHSTSSSLPNEGSQLSVRRTVGNRKTDVVSTSSRSILLKRLPIMR